MNDCVPDISAPSISPLKRLSGGDDQNMELYWQKNAPVAIYPPDKHSFTKPPSSSTVNTAPSQNPPPEAANNHLHMSEDEMALWLHYPLEEFYSELMLPNPTSAAVLPQSVIPVTEQATENHSALQQLPSRWHGSSATNGNFPQFSRIMAPLERLRSGFTVVESNDTPVTNSSNVEAQVVVPPSRPVSTVVSDATRVVIPGMGETLNVVEGGVGGGTTSPSRSSATSSATATASGTSKGKAGELRRGEVVCRKRKTRELEQSFAAATTAKATERQTEELEVESDEEKKNSRGSMATKRTRAADVHNLSERRRRDRINAKMKALQELIPRCNKSDKASMLEEAVEYIKALKMQTQMMAMGCGMMPMMYPGMQQQYMPPIPCTPPIPASQAPVANVIPPLAPRLPVQPFVTPCAQPTTPIDSAATPFALQTPGTGQIPNMVDPYHQFLTYQQMQMQMQALQSQTITQQVSSKPASNKCEVDKEKDVQ